MSSITVHFVGPVRRPAPEREMTVDITGLQTVADLLQRLGYKPKEQASLNVRAGGVRKASDDSLDGIESLEILIAIGGG